MTKRIYLEKDQPLPENTIRITEHKILVSPFVPYEHCPGEDWGVEDAGRFYTDLGHGWTKAGAHKTAVEAYKREFDKHYGESGVARLMVTARLSNVDIAVDVPLEDAHYVDYLVEVANEPIEDSIKELGKSMQW